MGMNANDELIGVSAESAPFFMALRRSPTDPQKGYSMPFTPTAKFHHLRELSILLSARTAGTVFGYPGENVVVWSLDTGQPIQTYGPLETNVHAFLLDPAIAPQFSSKKRMPGTFWVALVSSKNVDQKMGLEIQILEWREGQPELVHQSWFETNHWISNVALTSKGEIMITNRHSQQWKWALSEKTGLARLFDHPKSQPVPANVEDAVIHYAFSGDGKFEAILKASGDVVRVNTENGAKSYPLQFPSRGMPEEMRISNEGRYLAVELARKVWVGNLETGTSHMVPMDVSPGSVAFSPDSHYLVFVGVDGMVRSLDLENW
jgi:WD40 repeat protein